MTNEKFKEIIEFAINEEREAQKFYKKMQDLTKHDWSKKIFKELEDMEFGHEKLLLKYQNEGFEEFDAPKITDLKISNYLADVELHDNMSFQEILTVSMKKEEAANKLYSDLSGKANNDATKNLFLKLASEEAKHKLQLETVYDKEILKQN